MRLKQKFGNGGVDIMGKVLSPRKRPERKLEGSVRIPITFNNPKKKKLRGHSTQVVRETKLVGRMVAKSLDSLAKNCYPLFHEQSKKLTSESITAYEMSRSIHIKNNTFANELSGLTPRKFPATSLSFSSNQQEIKINDDLELESDEIEPFWRGVFVVPHQPKVLFSQKMELKPNKASTWKRHVVIDISRLEDDDE